MSSGLLPVAVYGLKVPAGDVMIPAIVDFPATFRITMAAIDPSIEPEHTGTANGGKPARATLKMVYDPSGTGDDDDSENEDSEDEAHLRALLAGDMEDDEDSSDDNEEKNGGPSDPSKTKKARKEAAVQQILESIRNASDEDDDEDVEDEMDVDKSPKANGLAKVDKGKGKAVEEDEDDDEDDEDELDGMEEVVICTLDPEKKYQQTLDITIPEDQNAYFKVSGTHAIYLTGNYVLPVDSGHSDGPSMYDDSDDDDEDEYDLEPDMDELDGEDESDELDDLEDPRVTEVDSEDEKEAPKLVEKKESAKKGKNKRPAEDSEDEPANLDDIMAKSLKPEKAAEEPKLSKKQLKKLKKNDGKAVEAAESKDAKSNDKKVQFAKDLEAGPSSSTATLNNDSKPGVKVVQGVKIDDKKLGKGPAAKKGNKVGMRYIGKLSNGKVFDACKSGPPFKFKLGAGEVIKGWDIGVAGMAVGGERRIIVPANLAYGNKKLPDIPANSELTFDLKLLEIN